jgi:hypothetical protein
VGDATIKAKAREQAERANEAPIEGRVMVITPEGLPRFAERHSLTHLSAGEEDTP